MKWYKQLHWQIIIGLVFGLLWGIFASFIGEPLLTFTGDYIKPFGTIFTRLLKLIAIPLVLVSLIVGVANLNDMTKLSRIGGKTIGIYIVTTVLAITIGLTIVSIIAPGKYLPEELRDELQLSYQDKVETSESMVQDIEDRGPLEFIINIFPENLFYSFSYNANMLQIVFVALLLGIGLIGIPSKNGLPLLQVCQSANDLIIKVVHYIMKFAPIGVFGLLAGVIIDIGGDDINKTLELLQGLLGYGLVVLCGLMLHIFLVYTSIVRFYGKMNLKRFFKGIRPAILLGFSTSSSSATLPVTMNSVQENLGVKEEVASFVLPVGATINMDGTSLYQAIAAVFIAQAIGLDLNFVDMITIVITATLASIGTAGVPGAGIIMLVIVLQSIQVPAEGIALIIGIDRILDMLRTTVNITGDASVSLAIDSSEKRAKEKNNNNH